MRSMLTLLVLLGLVLAPQSRGAEETTPKIQIAILLDTSGSMEGLIAQAQTQLWKIVNEFATSKWNGQSPEIEVALYEYGKSSLNAKEGYLRQILTLTDDLDRVSAELFALKTNGGEEYCGWVIQSATQELPWSQSELDVKSIFIAGNEPFSQGQVDYRKACQAAIEKGITVNTIFCGNEAEGIRTGWQQGSKLADGSFLCINQNQQAPQINAPQDDQLAKLSSKLNETYLAYGKQEKRKARKELQKKQDALAANAAAEVAADRAAAKASGLYRNAMWDLVDALEEGKLKLAEIKEEELPEELRKIEPEKRLEYIKQKAAEREQIKQQITELTEQRKKFIAKKRKEMDKSGDRNLNEAIIQAVRTQAEKKDFKFEE